LLPVSNLRSGQLVITNVLTTWCVRAIFGAMGAKSEHLQIRVTEREKALLKRAAAAAGQDLSTYVLARVIPPARVRFAELLTLLGEATDHRYALAELNDFLTALPLAELRDAVDHAQMDRLSPFLRNYVAAMVEQASAMKRVPAPAWTREVSPLDEPWFATSMKSLRLHLLRASPVPFKRRNIFVDASVGSRV
jgi:hypothetical protein